MPQLAAIVLADGQVVPANHTFSPSSSTGQKADWLDRSAGTPAGFQGISMEVRKPSSAGSAHRVIIGMNLPVVATVDGSPQVVRYNTAKMEINFSSASSEQERKDAVAFLKNFLGNATVAGAIKDLEPFY